MSAFVFWTHTKELINISLGVGYGPEDSQACACFKELDGDFGIPTPSDISDFWRLIGNLNEPSPRQILAKEICIKALRLYIEITKSESSL